MKASESVLNTSQFISTGAPKLDESMGGGVRLRKITMFSGRYSVGKTTISCGAIRDAQQKGLNTLWLDSENRFPFEYAELLGVDLDKLELETMKYAEDLFNSCEEWTRKHKNSLIVLDSVGGLLSKKEAKQHSGEEGYPITPRLIPGYIRRMVALLAEQNSALILLNHEKLDFATGAIKVLGGEAPKFHTDTWVRLRQLTNKKVMQGDVRVGDVIEASIQKGVHKGAKVELVLMAGKGFSMEADKLDEMLKSGEITKKGNTFWHGDIKAGVGLAKAREYVKSLSV